ncbi:hypothetical protein [Deinococcus sp. AJ005]|uniref:hypothetical protein n=1 Tax=Deinococcus sp. AJ005 TaxID=2652443 RepID=UPI00125CC38E|nr:hypothetical protein [Deinococcus sp. AJ005]QFP78047.1 hypothetical protein DAAJ005_17570 [Deinococcus sp. AJ005]
MTSAASVPSVRRVPIDLLTVVSIAFLAYLLGTALHEHLGHAVSCLALGGTLRELGAFYVDCSYGGMSDLGIRLVALAGPLVSLLTGLVCFAVLRAGRVTSPHLIFFLWLLGSVGALTASGYLLFSGVTGLGDFGTSRDGAAYELSPEWLWRTLLVALGVAAYTLSVRVMLARMGAVIGGEGVARVRHAQRLSLTSYLAGGVVSVLVGLFNPLGLVIVLTSAAAASLGGTSGLAWTMQFMNRHVQSSQPPLALPRNWAWTLGGLLFTLLYAVFLGPSIRLR